MLASTKRLTGFVVSEESERLESTGIVARVAGVVVDAEFPSGDLPSIHGALAVQRDDGPELVVEVQEHIDPHTVRAVAMGNTAGLRRGLPVTDTGHPIRVPVGRATLGRMFNVLGQPIDGQPAPGDRAAGGGYGGDGRPSRLRGEPQERGHGDPSAPPRREASRVL